MVKSQRALQAKRGKQCILFPLWSGVGLEHKEKRKNKKKREEGERDRRRWGRWRQRQKARKRERIYQNVLSQCIVTFFFFFFWSRDTQSISPILEEREAANTEAG